MAAQEPQSAFLEAAEGRLQESGRARLDLSLTEAWTLSIDSVSSALPTDSVGFPKFLAVVEK